MEGAIKSDLPPGNRTLEGGNILAPSPPVFCPAGTKQWLGSGPSLRGFRFVPVFQSFQPNTIR